jgi:MFS family permease
MTLFPILVRARGGTLASVSDMWILMLALEIPLVYWTGASVARLGARGAIAAGVAAGALRWGVCGLTSDLGAIFAAQILHGVVVFGVAIGAPLYVDAVVPERLRSTAQGLLAMVGVSLGGILSSLAAGALLERVGPDAPYRAGGAAALGLLALLPILLPPPRRSPAALQGAEEVS